MAEAVRLSAAEQRALIPDAQRYGLVIKEVSGSRVLTFASVDAAEEAGHRLADRMKRDRSVKRIEVVDRKEAKALMSWGRK